ncbi:MAG: recombinase family protein [Planctomycetes bacterium]|nr:recombinase family protein [Planctomycetota bacterium]
MPGFPAGVHKKGGAVSAPVHREAARQFYAPLLELVLQLHRAGRSLRQIAAELDRRGVKTRAEYPGQRWSATQVRRVLARARAAVAAPGRAWDAMTAAELLEYCRGRGYVLASAADGGVVFHAAKDRPDELVEALRAHVVELRALVQAAGGRIPPPSVAAELLARCKALGCALSVRNGKLVLCARDPQSADTAALRAELLAHEPEVIRLLGTQAGTKRQ